MILVESGGENLTATFSPALADVQIFVFHVAGGDKVLREGGPGIARSDLLVINKTDLAPFVGADLTVMDTDAARLRRVRRCSAAPASRPRTWAWRARCTSTGPAGHCCATGSTPGRPARMARWCSVAPFASWVPVTCGGDACRPR